MRKLYPVVIGLVLLGAALYAYTAWGARAYVGSTPNDGTDVTLTLSSLLPMGSQSISVTINNPDAECTVTLTDMDGNTGDMTLIAGQNFTFPGAFSTVYIDKTATQIVGYVIEY